MLEVVQVQWGVLSQPQMGRLPIRQQLRRANLKHRQSLNNYPPTSRHSLSPLVARARAAWSIVLIAINTFFLYDIDCSAEHVWTYLPLIASDQREAKAWPAFWSLANIRNRCLCLASTYVSLAPPVPPPVIMDIGVSHPGFICQALPPCAVHLSLSHLPMWTKLWITRTHS